MQTLQLLPDKPTGEVVTALVYDPTNNKSRGDAEDVMDILNHGVKVLGYVKPVGLMVPVTDLSKLTKARVAFVMEGTQAYMDKIATAANAYHILTMSADLTCVRTDKCVLGMTTEPATDIYFSKSAADAAKITFAPAFLMLVKQI